jgi:hypothetical protein
MHVFQTAGDPPSRAKSILPIMGWTRNSREEPTKRVRGKNRDKGRSP